MQPTLPLSIFGSSTPCEHQTIDAHGLKIQGEGPWGFCKNIGGRVYRGYENLLGRVHLFGVLLKFYKNFVGMVHFYLPSPPSLCASIHLTDRITAKCILGGRPQTTMFILRVIVSEKFILLLHIGHLIFTCTCEWSTCFDQLLKVH